MQLPNGRFVDPKTVTTHFHLRPGDQVADYGAGSGYFVRELAAAVGEEGKVYACEIQKSLVEKIGELARQDGLEQVQVLWCDLEAPGGTKLQDNVLDAAILVNTLFQIDDKPGACQEITRTLRPGGKLFVIDWSESFAGLGPQESAVVSEANARALFEDCGFTFERSFDAGDHHYGIALRHD